MSRRRSFVPEGLIESSLEGRVVLSFFGSVGDWFSSQYHHVTQDLGITHKHTTNATGVTDPIVKQVPTLGKAQPASSGLVHFAHPAKVK